MPTATETLTGSQTPTFQHQSKRAKNFKDSEKVERFMRAYGQAVQLDPWQRDLLYQMLARDKDGLLVHKTCSVSVPRQNGKGVLIEARVLYGAIVLKEDIICTSHHMATTLSTFNRICSYLEDPKNAELAEKVKVIRKANGKEAIEFKNGAIIYFLARTKSSGRGKTASVLIYDEAQELGKEAHAALLPTVSSRKDAQVILLGTPDTGTSDSEVFTKIRDTAHKKKTQALFHAEWSASLEDNPEAPATWAKTNPALGRRLSIENVTAEFDGFEERQFMIERLGVWFSNVGQTVVDMDKWSNLVADNLNPKDLTDLVLGLDMNPARTTATISVAAKKPDGTFHIEFRDSRADGTGWVVPRLKEMVLKAPIRTIVIDAKSPAASLIDQISAIRGLKVKTTGVPEMIAACGQFYDAIEQGKLSHRSQPTLNQSVAVGRKRTLGDGWAWSRATTTSDITPLVSSTLALWGCQSSKVRKKKTTTTADGTQRKGRAIRLR